MNRLILLNSIEFLSRSLAAFWLAKFLDPNVFANYSFYQKILMLSVLPSSVFYLGHSILIARNKKYILNRITSSLIYLSTILNMLAFVGITLFFEIDTTNIIYLIPAIIFTALQSLEYSHYKSTGNMAFFLARRMLSTFLLILSAFVTEKYIGPNMKNGLFSMVLVPLLPSILFFKYYPLKILNVNQYAVKTIKGIRFLYKNGAAFVLNSFQYILLSSLDILIARDFMKTSEFNYYVLGSSIIGIFIAILIQVASNFQKSIFGNNKKNILSTLTIFSIILFGFIIIMTTFYETKLTTRIFTKYDHSDKIFFTFFTKGLCLFVIQTSYLLLGSARNLKLSLSIFIANAFVLVMAYLNLITLSTMYIIVAIIQVIFISHLYYLFNGIQRFNFNLQE